MSNELNMIDNGDSHKTIVSMYHANERRIKTNVGGTILLTWELSRTLRKISRIGATNYMLCCLANR